jgi:uncharacterized protein DUF6622
MSVVRILSHTPIWIWLLLAFLLYRGLAALRPREVSPSRVLVIPIVFFIWGLAGLWSAREAAVFHRAVFLGGVALGAAAGLALASITPAPRWTPATGMLTMPGSAKPLVMICLAFATKYAAAVALAISADAVARGEVWALSASLGGAFAGLFWGRAAGQLLQALLAGGRSAGLGELVSLVLTRASQNPSPAA